jgi:predicted component of type VI protein secretion system
MAAQNFQLVMRSGPEAGMVFELTQAEITIGRDMSCTIVINDPEVSRKHARLVSQAGGYLIEDLGSTNGTFVNRQRLMGPHTLRHGEMINMGENVSLAFEAPFFDQAATQVSGAVSPGTPPMYQQPQTVPAGPAPSPYQPAEEDVYSGYVAPGPVEPAYAPSYQQRPPAPRANVPPGPAEPAYAPPQEYYDQEYYEPYEEQQRSRTWIFVGAGCLVVLLCVLVTAVVIFDFMDLYCTGPFEQFFNCP